MRIAAAPAPAPRDASARAQRQAASPATSAWVAASAGTGKTKVLVDRVLNLLLAGARPQRLLCLTFTKAAAQEMSLRLTDILRTWTTAPPGELDTALAALAEAPPADVTRRRARRLFADVLDTPGGLRIDTIHAFCQSMLRRFPLEAGVPPNFQVLDERSAAELRQDCRDAVLDRARREPAGALAEALAVVTARITEQGLGEILAELMRERGRLRRLIGDKGRTESGVRRAMARLCARLEVRPGETEDEVLRLASADTAFDGDGLRRAARALLAGSATDKTRGETLAAWLADPAGRVARFAAYRSVYFTQAGKPLSRLITKDALAGAPGVDAILAREGERLEKVIARCNAAATAANTAALLRLGAALEEQYERAKDDRAMLDYDDLILRARDLLRRPGVAPWVLYKLDGGIDHILIDEAQDTNPEQWEVIEALTGEFFVGQGRERSDPAAAADRTVFAVGDVKQSIYSFQRADPQAFVDLRERFAGRARAADKHWTNVDLTVSFRSTRAVLDAVDAVFARPAARAGVALDGADIRHTTDRIGQAGLVELWPPVVPSTPVLPQPWAPPVERIEEDSPAARLARLIARTVAGWIERQEILESKGRPIRAEDVMILVRRRNILVDLLVRELKQAGIDVAGVDRMILADQLAIMDLIALGRFLLLPEDDLTLATVLKGPLFGFSEERLFELAWNRQPDTLWTVLRRRAGDNAEFAAAAQELSQLLARVDFVRPHELFAEVLGPRGGRARLVGRLGVEAHDPLDEFLAATLAFERRHPPALETFLHWLEAGREEVKRDLESHARDEVRIMTVHGAKGLQAPIVILPDTFQVPTPGAHGPKLLWTRDTDGAPDLLLWSPHSKRDDRLSRDARQEQAQAQMAEYRRLLYVALTRAEDRLYVCGYQPRNKPPDGCWYNLIKSGLEDIAERFAFQAEGGDPAGPGWRLAGPQERPPGRSQPRAPAPPPAPPRWAGRAPPDEPDPPRPLIPSQADGEEPPALAPFDVAADTRRFRRGRLVHRLLQSLPDLPAAERAAAARRFLARPAHRLTADEQEALAREIMAVLVHPEWAALFGPGSVAEVPVVGRVGARIVSGQIDRLVVGDEAVLILDYKTNRPPPAEPRAVAPVYVRQMAAYRAAIGGLYPGRRLRCALLWTDGPRLMELPDDLLARYAP
jgi:ATP-dependent helicase/nuclease subunit A